VVSWKHFDIGAALVVRDTWLTLKPIHLLSKRINGQPRFDAAPGITDVLRDNSTGHAAAHEMRPQGAGAGRLVEQAQQDVPLAIDCWTLFQVPQCSFTNEKAL
jgi:hypothetical protein